MKNEERIKNFLSTVRPVLWKAVPTKTMEDRFFEIGTWIHWALIEHQIEEEAREYYDNYHPNLKLDYQGITTLDTRLKEDIHLLPQSEAPFYFPAHYVQPITPQTQHLIDLD